MYDFLKAINSSIKHFIMCLNVRVCVVKFSDPVSAPCITRMTWIVGDLHRTAVQTKVPFYTVSIRSDRNEKVQTPQHIVKSPSISTEYFAAVLVGLAGQRC